MALRIADKRSRSPRPLRLDQQTDSQLIGAGTPREAVAGGYGFIFVPIAPAGAVLVAQIVLIVSEDRETAFAALCFAVRRNPINGAFFNGLLRFFPEICKLIFEFDVRLAEQIVGPTNEQIVYYLLYFGEYLSNSFVVD